MPNMRSHSGRASSLLHLPTDRGVSQHAQLLAQLYECVCIAPVCVCSCAVSAPISQTHTHTGHAVECHYCVHATLAVGADGVKINTAPAPASTACSTLLGTRGTVKHVVGSLARLGCGCWTMVVVMAIGFEWVTMASTQKTTTHTQKSGVDSPDRDRFSERSEQVPNGSDRRQTPKQSTQRW